MDSQHKCKGTMTTRSVWARLGVRMIILYDHGMYLSTKNHSNALLILSISPIHYTNCWTKWSRILAISTIKKKHAYITLAATCKSIVEIWMPPALKTIPSAEKLFPGYKKRIRVPGIHHLDNLQIWRETDNGRKSCVDFSIILFLAVHGIRLPCLSYDSTWISKSSKMYTATHQ